MNPVLLKQYQVSIRNLILLLSIVCGSSDPVSAQSGSTSAHQSAQASVGFVQKFLAWYVPIANSETRHGSASWQVLANGNDWVTPGLAEILRADSTAKMASQPTRETFNADPFLDSQDPCPAYEAVGAVAQGNTYIVKVAPKCGAGNWGKRDTISYVVIWRASKPQISDIEYVASERSLVGWLCLYESKDSKVRVKSRVCSATGHSN